FAYLFFDASAAEKFNRLPFFCIVGNTIVLIPDFQYISNSIICIFWGAYPAFRSYQPCACRERQRAPVAPAVASSLRPLLRHALRPLSAAIRAPGLTNIQQYFQKQ